MSQKKPFITLEQAKAIAADYPTPFHIYDEAGIRRTARALNQAFSWNQGFKEYFAVKATPNPFILKILREEGCGVDCSSETELMLSKACGFAGEEIGRMLANLLDQVLDGRLKNQKETLLAAAKEQVKRK